MRQPSVFIGSSGEGLKIAQAIKVQLSNDAEVTVWNEGVFGISKTAVESILAASEQFDFAILVLTPDDFVLSRNQSSLSARDNVLLELGVFMGSLGRERAFIVCSDDKRLQLPSDLKGVTVARYPSAQASRNLIAAVGAACAQIRTEIETLGPSEGRRLQQINQVTAQMEVLFKKTNQLLEALDVVHTKPKWFETVAKAEDEMVGCLKECVDQKEGILIQWLGMTMYNVWNTLPRVLDELAALHPTNVKLQVAMLSKEWLAQNRINDAWTPTSAEETRKRILQYFDKRNREGDRNWSSEVHRYSHMPAVHGGLINGRYLFLGICRWDRGDLWAGDRPYELYRLGDANHGSDKIRVFDSWFEICNSVEANPGLLAWPKAPPKRQARGRVSRSRV